MSSPGITLTASLGVPFEMSETDARRAESEKRATRGSFGTVVTFAERPAAFEGTENYLETLSECRIRADSRWANRGSVGVSAD